MTGMILRQENLPLERPVWVLQHVRCESLGSFARVLRAAKIQTRYIRVFEGEPIPSDIARAAGLVILGGPMGVYEHDRYPFLLEEMRLIEQALMEEKPILGVCLGCQLLAAVLGATVAPGAQKEIGWFPVTLTESARCDPLWKGIESPFVAYHWHGDVFDLPRVATPLASSELTHCQGFRYGALAYGLLFHVEVTEVIIRHMVAAFWDELATVGLWGQDIIGRADEHLPRLNMIAQAVFLRWTGLMKGANR